MKRLFELLLVVAVLALAASCASTTPVTLSPAAVSGSRAENNDNLSSVRKDDFYIGVSGSAVQDNKSLFFVTVGNESQNSVKTFQDSDLEIFVGDRMKNRWTSLGSWSADRYYMNAAKEARNMKFLVGVVGVLDIVASSVDYAVSYDGNGHYHYDRFYDPWGAAFAFDRAMYDQMAIDHITKSDLEYLKNNLLYSKTLSSGESYSGIVVSKAKDNCPDYMFVYGGDKSTAMVFERSDADDIRYPWRDKKVRSTMSLVASKGYNAPSSVILVGNSPSGISLYGGGSWMTQSDLKDTSYENRFGMPFGISSKGAPYAWLLAGADFGLLTPKDIAKDPKFDVELQTGLNWVINYLDVNAMVHFSPITKRFGYSIGGGFAF